MREFDVETGRKTELVNITEQVREAVKNGGGGSAALVYVPHTTAAVTINENTDPNVRKDMIKELLKTIPLGRVGSVGDVAGVILFLASPMADYLNGVTIDINGGSWFH